MQHATLDAPHATAPSSPHPATCNRRQRTDRKQTTGVPHTAESAVYLRHTLAREQRLVDDARAADEHRVARNGRRPVRLRTPQKGVCVCVGGGGWATGVRKENRAGADMTMAPVPERLIGGSCVCLCVCSQRMAEAPFALNQTEQRIALARFRAATTVVCGTVM
jgi:hypothetical protein